jgi:16S rRNA (adenine1518-N6/adenine1519-N6)-dimethyltransferase
MPRRGDALPPPLKRLGQHFLSDPRILGRIADALAPGPAETVVEIGPGRGALTERLRERAGRVVAIELDRALAHVLRERYADDDRVTIVQGDALRTSLGDVGGEDYALIGNIPYYITTPILFHALEPPRPSRAVFVVQREVAERLTATPDDDAYGALSVNVQAVATVNTLFAIPAGAFQPPPSVESAAVRLTPRERPLVVPGMEDAFRRFVQGAFGLRRKQMRRVIRTLFGLDVATTSRLLDDAGVSGETRPERLTPEQFLVLLQAVRQVSPRDS